MQRIAEPFVQRIEPFAQRLLQLGLGLQRLLEPAGDLALGRDQRVEPGIGRLQIPAPAGSGAALPRPRSPPPRRWQIPAKSRTNPWSMPQAHLDPAGRLAYLPAMSHSSHPYRA